MAKNNQWLDWLKCNILEIIILVLVLTLLVKVYSAPLVEEISSVAEITAGESLAEETIPKISTEEVTAIETPVEKAQTKAEQPLEKEATPEPATEEIPTK